MTTYTTTAPQEMNLEAPTTAKTPSVKDTVTADGKLSFLELLIAGRYFLPVLTTIGWLIGFTLGHIPILSGIAIAFVAIGILSAITVSPLKFIKFIFKSAGKGFKICRAFIPFYGVADLCAAIFGTTFGLMFGLLVVFGIPAAFTIPKFFAEE